MERKTRFACRCRPARGLALALFALFVGLATAAQAMLLTLDLRWGNSSTTDATLKSGYNLQPGSIIQVIGYKSGEGEVWNSDVGKQFGDENGHAYGITTDTETAAAPYSNTTPPTNVPGEKDVWLADNTQDGHDILYTGSIQNLGSWYGLYTQITVDSYLYDTVYIRVFGATEIKQGAVTASYWGVSDPYTLAPSYATDKLQVQNLEANKPNYFEVIPEPATLGLLGLGGVALAAWHRRRFARSSEDGAARKED